MAKSNAAVSEVSEVIETIETVEALLVTTVTDENTMDMLSSLDDYYEVTETADEAPALVSEFALEAAVAGAERTEATLQAYADQDKHTEATPLNLDHIPDADEEGEESESGVVELEAEAVGKPPRAKAVRAPSPTTVSGKLIAKTYGDVGMFVLEPADAELNVTDMEAHAKALIDGADELPVKAGNKMQLLFGYLKNGGKLNEYLKRAFEVLIRDGEIITGDEGNYIQAMTKPTNGGKAFGLGTARSQVSQLGALLPYLKIATKESGKFVANADSVILMAVKESLAS